MCYWGYRAAGLSKVISFSLRAQVLYSILQWVLCSAASNVNAFIYFCCLISMVSSDLHMWDKQDFFETNKEKSYFRVSWFLCCFGVHAATRASRELHLLFLLFVSQPRLLCLSQSTSSSPILPVVPICKWRITSLTCNTVSKMKGNRGKKGILWIRAVTWWYGHLSWGAAGGAGWCKYRCVIAQGRACTLYTKCLE